MSLRLYQWLAVVFLVVAAGLFTIGYPMPVFEHPERVAALNVQDAGDEAAERFHRAVEQERTLKPTLERYGACFLVLALLTLELRVGRPVVVPGRARLLVYGLVPVVALVLLSLDALQRGLRRGLIPASVDPGPTSFLFMMVGVALLLVLAVFLVRVVLGVGNAGSVSRALALGFGLLMLAVAVRGLAGGDYVGLATGGGLAVFFWYFLWGSLVGKRR
ncbi:hypothetical protein ACX3YG_21175 [Pseudomonas wadenswilerensis]